MQMAVPKYRNRLDSTDSANRLDVMTPQLRVRAFAASTVALLLAGSLIAPAWTVAAELADVVDLPADSSRIAVADSGLVVATLPTTNALAVATPGESPRTIDLAGAGEVYDVVLTSDGRYAFVSRLPSTDEDPGRIERVTIDTGDVAEVTGTEEWPTSLALTDDDATLVTTMEGVSALGIIDTATLTLRQSVRTPYAASVAVDDDLAFVAGVGSVTTINVKSGKVTETLEVPSPLSPAHVDAAFGRVVVGLTSAGAPPQVWSFEIAKPRTVQRLTLTAANESEFTSWIVVAAGYSQTYVSYGLGFTESDGSYFAATVIPTSRDGFGTPEALLPSPPVVRDLVLDPTGATLALGGVTSATPQAWWYDTDDIPEASVEISARLVKAKGKQRLVVSGSTVGIESGASVTVYVKTGKKFRAQKAKATVSMDGRFTWKGTTRTKKARVYVVIDDLKSQIVIARR